MLQCPFCKNMLSDTLDSIGRICPVCQKDVFMEVEQNFRKVMEFSGEFIRLNRGNKSHPFLKTYRAGGKKTWNSSLKKAAWSLPETRLNSMG